MGRVGLVGSQLRLKKKRTSSKTKKVREDERYMLLNMIMDSCER